jgi:hypothetical protein
MESTVAMLSLHQTPLGQVRQGMKWGIRWALVINTAVALEQMAKS